MVASGMATTFIRDASGWVVFQSDPDDIGPQDPVALIDDERDRRIRQLSGNECLPTQVAKNIPPFGWMFWPVI